MSVPINNINQGGYVPSSFGAGYPPSAPSTAASAGNQPPPYNPAPNYGFMQHNQQPAPTGYTPGYVGPPTQMQPQAPPAQPIPAQTYGGPMAPPMATQHQPPYSYTGTGGFHPAPTMPGQMPVTTQPGMQSSGNDAAWMPTPIAGIPNCPRGLEYLAAVDQLLVKQKVELLEAFTGFETNNKFSIKNALGQKVFNAVETTDCCTRNMCGSARPFELRIFDNFQNEVIHLDRPLACSLCCFPCCLQKLEVQAPPGNVIGTIEQEWTLCAPAFVVRNNIGDALLRIEGPLCPFAFCGNVNYEIISMAGVNVGKISKQWTGLARELFTDADVFGIQFPLELDVKTKALLLGATFLIDAMFFENNGDCNGN